VKNTPSVLEILRTFSCGRPGQAEGTHAGAHTDTAYTHASPTEPDGRARPACALTLTLALALSLSLSLSLAAHALSPKADLPEI
jgi:hypothetical protein